jgi:hypothetical protein
MNVKMRVHILRTFVTHLLVHMHQKEEIALEIAAKIASVKRALTQFQRRNEGLPEMQRVN